MTRRCCVYCGTEMNEWYNESIPLTGSSGSSFCCERCESLYMGRSSISSKAIPIEESAPIENRFEILDL